MSILATISLKYTRDSFFRTISFFYPCTTAGTDDIRYRSLYRWGSVLGQWSCFIDTYISSTHLLASRSTFPGVDPCSPSAD